MSKQHTLNNLPQGWAWRETPGHGYLIPASLANEKVPYFLRTREYEEDCAYSIPVCFNADLFTEETVKNCMDSFKNWYPKEYEKAYKVELKPGESHLKDQYFFSRKDNLGKYGKYSGFGDWCYQVPPGYVYAILRQVTPADISYNITTLKGPELTGLIKSEIYNASDYFDLSQIIPFKRDETYYTWESYQKATGCERFNIIQLEKA